MEGRADMNQSTQIIANSIWEGHQITTWHLKIWKPLVAQMNKHRIGAQSTASSRAMSIMGLIDQVDNGPFIPIFTKNRKGMGGEVIPEGSEEYQKVLREWLSAAGKAANHASNLNYLGVSKEIANRLLEPFLVVDMVATFERHYLDRVFFPLRLAKDAQPDMQWLAQSMLIDLDNSIPDETPVHLPWGIVDIFESASACARASYGGAGQVKPDDEARGRKLMQDKHWTPFEHRAMAGKGTRQFRHWVCSREILEQAI
jgi:thymidylate synthase ThyX